MIEAAESAFVSMRRRYRHALRVRSVRNSSKLAHRHGLRVVHMLHVGKTGGTAVQAALNGAELPPGLSLLFHGHGISLPDVPPEDEVFFFLREPVARFVSGFVMRRSEGRPRHYRPWTPAERRAFTRFDSAEALAMALRARGRSKGAMAERAEALRAMRSIYHVQSHLGDWLVAPDVVRSRQSRLLFIGWQERLEADFNVLLSALGIIPAPSLPANEYDANRASVDEGHTPLSEEAVAILHEWYADDYMFIALLHDLGLTEPPDEVLSALARVR